MWLCTKASSSLTLILSLLSFSPSNSLSQIVGLGFGFALIFCCGYWCICKFMVVALGGCGSGGEDGFIEVATDLGGNWLEFGSV